MLFFAPAVSDLPVPSPPAPTYNGVPMPDLAVAPVQMVLPDGFVVTAGEAVPLRQAPAPVPQPSTSPESYRYDLCLQLQDAKPWTDWGCVKP